MQIDHEIVVYVVYYVYTNIIYIYMYILDGLFVVL